jgi:hypothetical protein
LEDNIKMDLKGTELEIVDWLKLVQDMCHWQALANKKVIITTLFHGVDLLVFNQKQGHISKLPLHCISEELRIMHVLLCGS